MIIQSRFRIPGIEAGRAPLQQVVRQVVLEAATYYRTDL